MSPRRSPEFRITVESRSAVSVYRSGRPRTTGTVNAASGGIADKTITVLNDWLTSGRITNREELVVLGSHLYDVLLSGAVNDVFRDACAEAEQAGTVLRVILEFSSEAKDLAVWPWEYLYVPDSPMRHGFFIARRTKLVLSRHVAADLGNDFWPPAEEEHEPVRVLVVVSRPSNADTVMAEPVIEHLRELFDVELLKDPTRLEFEERMREGTPPHIVHFVGHGKFDGGAGWLAFVRDGEAEWLNERAFAECFMEARPRLVFLQACEGAGTSSHEALSGLALKLAHNRIPAVIAMRYKVENQHATSFARAFYEEIRNGLEVDQAVQRARWALVRYLDDPTFSARVFGCPVVYLQYVDQDEPRAFHFPAPVATATASETAAPPDPRGNGTTGQTTPLADAAAAPAPETERLPPRPAPGPERPGRDPLRRIGADTDAPDGQKPWETRRF